MAKTNKGLVKFAKQMLAKGDDTIYVYGTFGQKLTTTLINQKANQYTYNVSRKALYKKVMNSSGTEYAFDCVGLIKAYMWNWNNGSYKYKATQDKSANGMYGAAKVKGNIKTIPEVEGILVQMDGHIGIYIGNGYVIECTPAKAFAKQTHGGGGVCKTKLKDRKWEHWLECPYITYEKEEVKKTIEQIAKEVIDGKWGTGSDRKNRLTKAGYDYNKVQAKVNELLAKPKKKTITQIAKEVIDGKWGNGTNRKNALIKAGYDYNAVQKEVNRLLK